MRNRLVLLALGLFVPILLSAHHGAAAFEEGKTVLLKGTVKSWLYSNPHCLLTLDVKDDHGQVTEWIAETQAPVVMFTIGYRKNSFQPGDQVSITVEQVKNGRPIGRIIHAVLADGTKLVGRTPADVAP